MKAKITVMPKKTVLDPQGKTVLHALESMGFKGLKEVRVGKFIEVELAGTDDAAVQKKMDEACHKLLSNPVIEDYEVVITKDSK
jgi:phosphoribosylformylglycinamidine synthase